MSYLLRSLPNPLQAEGELQVLGSAFWDTEIRAIDPEKRLLSMVGSTEVMDRDKDVILVRGWILDMFRKNPQFLWMHSHHTPPIGRALQVTKDLQKKQLRFILQFADAEAYPFADAIFRLFQGGFLRASSVGFIPKDAIPGPALQGHGEEDSFEERRKPRHRIPPGINPETRRIFVKQELLELSAVTIPSNPEALAEAYQKGVINAVEGSWLIDKSREAASSFSECLSFIQPVDRLGGVLKINSGTDNASGVVIPTRIVGSFFYAPHTLSEIPTEEMLKDEKKTGGDPEEIWKDRISKTPCLVEVIEAEEEEEKFDLQENEIEENGIEDRAVVGSARLSLAPVSRSWDSGAARRRIRSWASSDGEVSIRRYRQAFVWRREGEDEGNLTAYSFPFADVIEGELGAVFRAVVAGIAVVNGARGGTDLPRRPIYNFLARQYSRFPDVGEPPPFRGERRAYSDQDLELRLWNLVADIAESPEISDQECGKIINGLGETEERVSRALEDLVGVNESLESELIEAGRRLGESLNRKADLVLQQVLTD